MKAQVVLDAAIVIGQGVLIVIQRLTHLQQLFFCAPPRSQGRGLRLQPHAQLKNAAHAGGGGTGQVYALGLFALKNKGTNPVPGLNEARCLQSGNRFAYYRTAHPLLADDDRLGGQLVPRSQLPQQNLPGQFGHDVVGQTRRALAYRLILHGYSLHLRRLNTITWFEPERPQLV